MLTGPKGRFALGRVTELGADREFQTGPQHDVLRLRFHTTDDLEKGDLRQFLTEHLASLPAGGKKVAGATA